VPTRGSGRGSDDPVIGISEPRVRLSSGERAVAALAVVGLTRRAIGERLGISAGAVGARAGSACRKAGINGGVGGLRDWLAEEARGDLAGLGPFGGRVRTPTVPATLVASEPTPVDGRPFGGGSAASAP
jgi:DNA-binding CsgD family transcriptional regulator